MTTRKPGPSQTKQAVAIIDDHPLVCAAVERAINNEPDLYVCGSARDVENALELVRRQKVDIILVDLSLDQSSGFALLEALRREYPDLPAVVLSMHEESTHAVRAVRSGARGYVMKNQSLETIINAIRHVLGGNVWLKEEWIRQASDNPNANKTDPLNIPNLLTERELEIFEMIGHGMSAEKIARKLFISKRTVQSHRDHIKTKLNIPSVLQLHKIAFQWLQEKI